MASLFITPLTYEGLIDELYDIYNGRVLLDNSMVDDSSTTTSSSSSSSSSLYSYPYTSSSASANNTQSQLQSNIGGGKVNKVFVNLNRVSTTTTATSNPNSMTPIPPPPSSSIINTSTLPISSDMLYNEIRDLSIEVIGLNLRQKAQAIKNSYSSFRDNKDASISDIHNFIKKIPNLTSNYKTLNLHINMTSYIKQMTDSVEFREFWQTERGIIEGDNCYDALEEFIYADIDRIGLFHVLRLICLQSLVNNGVKSNRYELLKKLIIQTYGFGNICILTNLEKTGM